MEFNHLIFNLVKFEVSDYLSLLLKEKSNIKSKGGTGRRG
jgi:hypothetical protein